MRRTGFRVFGLAFLDLFIVGRLAGGLFLVGLVAFQGPTLAPVALTLAVAGTAAWVVGTVIAILAARGSRGHLGARALWAIAVIDSVALGALTVPFGGDEDPFYAWYLAEAITFSLLLGERRAWTFAGLFSASYLIGHAAYEVVSVVQYVMLIAKTLIMLFLSAIVGMVMERHIERETELEEHGEEMELLNARLERSVGVLRAVSEVTELVHSTLDTETVGPTVLDIVQHTLGIPAGCLFVIDKQRQQTVFTASRGVPDSEMSPLVDQMLADPARESFGGAHLACTEALTYNDLIVVFCAESVYIEGLNDDDRMVLLAVAQELAVAVENSRLYKLTKRLAVTDELTGLYNYRHLQQRLDEEISRARRYDKRLSFLMLDVDNFKRVNDVYGHRVGDMVLAEVGHVLRTTVREVDVVARYGGEEFSVLLVETDASGAFIAAEKIREAVAAHRFADEEGERVVQVTASIGLANYPLHAYDKESLLKAADDALYQAKNAGKDRVRAPKVRLPKPELGTMLEQRRNEEDAE